MGMFDKDKLFAPEGAMRDWTNEDTPFILWAIEVRGNVPTPNGPTDDAPMVWLTVSHPDSPDSRDVVSMIGDNIKEKAEAVEDGDLPAVCVTKSVPSSIEGGNDAYVLNWHSDYKPTSKVEKAAKS